MRITGCLVLITTLITILLLGCATTRSRIKEHEREFNTFPAETQAQIQSGRIDKGFTEEMVYMARGEPSDKSMSTRDGKPTVVWKYPRPAAPLPVGAQSGSLSTPYGYPGFGPGPAQPAPMFYERSYFKVEFLNGKVVGWDQDLQDDSGVGVPIQDMKMPSTPY
ncbi:MAG: hypothetical protein HY074_03745 [Deltaproteobacteria bacterium]|nr:hypothetical protein [Deltaproteobacteria bacterium]